MVPDLRKQEILKYMTGKDVVYMQDLADELDISLSTIRRDLQALQEEGEVVLMRGGAARIMQRDFDEPVVRKKLINSEAKEIIAKKAAALVEDGDCIYVDSGTTTVAMLKYLAGKQITIVSSSTQLMEYMPIKGAKCILLGGEVRDDLESVFGSLTEKMISNLYFDKAFIGANGYIEDGAIYTYDPREARKKEIVKEYSRTAYVMMDTSKKNKHAFAKVFELNECILITEAD
ncbi:DeoR/GlpR family DNA-binding transcription regulator [Anaerobium acetethylicum]|uniref:DeoR family transcriptional regulator, fructose operon transcriptional repressor n=1 Tax=Anaerobium acetethylicum TaxID=1619234 RepID=A0A1D3TUE2_9FIRM|nr:DeoR/GlpR family DNA-binding transcription regulator [Anaerobium acetethylicum]SCP97646.1 DeoR family transcriptional regulator, fructose operon transcriptional repressor [Anaerobium acetethylicum]